MSLVGLPLPSEQAPHEPLRKSYSRLGDRVTEDVATSDALQPGTGRTHRRTVRASDLLKRTVIQPDEHRSATSQSPQHTSQHPLKPSWRFIRRAKLSSRVRIGNRTWVPFAGIHVGAGSSSTDVQSRRASPLLPVMRSREIRPRRQLHIRYGCTGFCRRTSDGGRTQQKSPREALAARTARLTTSLHDRSMLR